MLDKDHPLSGNYEGHRECHITPDWLLIYKIERKILTLLLTRTGTHSDLFSPFSHSDTPSYPPQTDFRSGPALRGHGRFRLQSYTCYLS